MVQVQIKVEVFRGPIWIKMKFPQELPGLFEDVARLNIFRSNTNKSKLHA
jgi:hypothetical protein